MITKQSKSKSKPKTKPTSRKTKTKHKQKFLSLKLHLIAKTPKPPMPTTNDSKQLINLFPLHPENLMEQDKLDMSCIFSSGDDATTLTGILCSDDDDDDENSNIPSPSSVNYADEEVKLVRTAMKRKNYKNDHDHEKWVCYSEVVERKNVIRGMSSSSSTTTSCYHHNYFDDHDNNRSKLVLKLDYEKIMKSWVNKGPLYIYNNSDPDTPQTVPELKDDFFLRSSINGPTHGERDNEGSWMVPEMSHSENNGVGEGDDGLQAMGSSATNHNREASVQRYKEKRRNRLFAKTIRYEVRKLNAEKRPRIKGRFVKRN